MTLYWKRAGWGFLVLLIAAIALFASMVRIVPQHDLPVETRVELPTAAPAAIPVARVAQGPLPQLIVPVQGVPRSALADTWGQSRANGARTHQAIDIMAPGGTPVIAAAAGTVEKLFYSNGGGGITLYVRSPDRQWIYYYAHLQGYAPGVVEGMAVKQGDTLGYVGDTGNAGLGNYHLHFGIALMLPEERWHQGQPVNPYPLLAGSGGAP
jgi:murein DD-endopeptidase MepM/ murein hydrolase activator NlpD